MKIYQLQEVASKIPPGFLFLDNNALIAIINNPDEFGEFLIQLKDKGCALVTIPSVVFEFSRTDNIEGYNKRIDFINKYIGIWPIEKFLDSIKEIIPVLHELRGSVGYTDFLLHCCLYKFPNSYLLTENHKDFKTDILDRNGLITLDSDSPQIKNMGLYTFSHPKFEKAAANILKNRKLSY